jgi:hypothetical protein
MIPMEGKWRFMIKARHRTWSTFWYNKGVHSHQNKLNERHI